MSLQRRTNPPRPFNGHLRNLCDHQVAMHTCTFDVCCPPADMLVLTCVAIFAAIITTGIMIARFPVGCPPHVRPHTLMFRFWRAGGVFFYHQGHDFLWRPDTFVSSLFTVFVSACLAHFGATDCRVLKSYSLPRPSCSPGKGRCLAQTYSGGRT